MCVCSGIKPIAIFNVNKRGCKWVTALVSFFGDLAPLLGCWMAAKLMHEVMLSGIMKAPLNFFDTTPSGRILARFSKDIDVLDTSLPREISDCIYCVYEVTFNLYYTTLKLLVLHINFICKYKITSNDQFACLTSTCLFSNMIVF